MTLEERLDFRKKHGIKDGLLLERIRHNHIPSIKECVISCINKREKEVDSIRQLYYLIVRDEETE